MLIAFRDFVGELVLEATVACTYIHVYLCRRDSGWYVGGAPCVALLPAHPADGILVFSIYAGEI